MSLVKEGSLKKVAYNTTYYTISTILLRASSIIFFPIFSKYLSLSDYGTLSLAQNIAVIVALMGGLGLSRSLTRFIYFRVKDSEVDKEIDHNTIIYTTLIASLVGLTGIVLVVILIGPFILKPILGGIPFYPYIPLALSALPLNAFIETARAYFIATHDGKSSFILDTSFFSLTIFFNLFYVVYLGFDVSGIFLGILTNTILFSIILLVLFYRKFKFRIDNSFFKSILRYTLPLVPFMFLNTLFDSVDKFFLNSSDGSRASGVYYLAMTFALMYSTFKESINQALTPWVYQNIEKDEMLIRKTFNKVIVLVGLVGLLISLYAKEFFILFSSNPELLVSYKYIPLTIVSFYIVSLAQLINIKTFYFGNYNKYVFIATLVALIVEFISCYFLIPKYSIYGAIYSRIIAFTIQTLIFLWFSKLEKEKQHLYDFNQLFLWTILISISIWLSSYLNLIENFYYSIPLKMLVSLLVCLQIYYMFKVQINIFVLSKKSKFLKQASGFVS